MVLLSGRRWVRLCHALLVAVVLLAGQRHAVLAADGDAMDSSQVSVCCGHWLVGLGRARYTVSSANNGEATTFTGSDTDRILLQSRRKE